MRGKSWLGRWEGYRSALRPEIHSVAILLAPQGAMQIET